MKLTGKRVVVIGGTSGIGFAVAAAALAEGADIFVGSSSESRTRDAIGRLGGTATGLPLDVRSEESIVRFAQEVGELDHLVYTAGDWGNRQARGINQVEVDDFSRSIIVRFTGALLAVKHLASKIRTSGSIVLTGGIVAHRPRRGAALNSATAGAVEHLTNGLAVDLAPIRVNAVCPGAIGTDIWGDDAAVTLRRMTDGLPIPRAGTPEEAAEAYLYLMKGGYTTGQVLIVDGGKMLI